MKRKATWDVSGPSKKARTGSAPRAKKRTQRSLAAFAHEPKYIVATLLPVGIDNTGTMGAFTMPAQGDSILTRDGDQVVLGDLKVRVTCGAGDATNLVRFMIFQWFPDNNIDAPAFGKILDDTVTWPVGSPIINAKANRWKFNMLADMTKPVSTNGPAVTFQEFTIPRDRLRKVFFNQGATTGRNLLYYAAISDSGAVTHPTLGFSMPLVFYDF